MRWRRRAPEPPFSTRKSDRAHPLEIHWEPDVTAEEQHRRRVGERAGEGAYRLNGLAHPDRGPRPTTNCALAFSTAPAATRSGPRSRPTGRVRRRR